MSKVTVPRRFITKQGIIMVQYEFLYYPVEGATEDESAGPIAVILAGESYKECVKKFAAWVEANEKLIHSIDEQAEQYVDDDRMNPRRFQYLPDDQPFMAYV